MKTVLVCVQSPQTARRLSACARTMGLAQTVVAVNHIPTMFAELSRRDVDVVLIDVGLAAPDPVRFTQAVRRRWPRIGVLFSGAADPRTATMVTAAGALGVIRAMANDADELLVGIAQAVMVARQGPMHAATTTPYGYPRRVVATRLTRRERQVLTAMSEGKANAEIGRALFVSEDTVKAHARRMYNKLGARSRAHAVAIAFRSGLLL